MDYINCFDSLITDYSSIYLDYMLLERPIIFLPYDLQEYESSVGFTMDYMENTPGPKPVNFHNFLTELKKCQNPPQEYLELLHELNIKLNSLEKDACHSLGEIIKSK